MYIWKAMLFDPIYVSRCLLHAMLSMLVFSVSETRTFFFLLFSKRKTATDFRSIRSRVSFLYLHIPEWVRVSRQIRRQRESEFLDLFCCVRSANRIFLAVRIVICTLKIDMILSESSVNYGWFVLGTFISELCVWMCVIVVWFSTKRYNNTWTLLAFSSLAHDKRK